MIVELLLNGTVEFRSPIVRIRNEINQGLQLTNFYIEETPESEIYVPPFSADNKYTLRYLKDDGVTLLQEFPQVVFRFSDTGPWYTTITNVTEIQFMIEKV